MRGRDGTLGLKGRGPGRECDTEHLLQGVARDPQGVPELDDRQAAAAVRGSPLAHQAVGLVPSNSAQNSGFLDGQEIR